MFRASSSRLVPRRALLSASAAATGLALTNSTDQEKFSIYPTRTPDVLLVGTPSALEQEIGVVRRKVTAVYREAHSQVQGVVSRWIGVETAVENRVKTIISPNEQVTPGLLYVGVATLAGSILARTRGLPTRFLLPPLLGFITAKHFIPETTANLGSYFASLEETYFPNFADKHDTAKAHSRMAWDRVDESLRRQRQWLSDNAEVALAKVQEVTGLKLKETLGLAKKQVEAKAVEVAKAVEEKAAEAKVTADKAVKEAVETSRK